MFIPQHVRDSLAVQKLMIVHVISLSQVLLRNKVLQQFIRSEGG